jgi:hypothetical protein
MAVADRKPILVVCYTNHALDQFLNHILTFLSRNQLIRIGGRTKCKELEDCLLRNQSKLIGKIKFPWRQYNELRDKILYECGIFFKEYATQAVANY